VTIIPQNDTATIEIPFFIRRDPALLEATLYGLEEHYFTPGQLTEAALGVTASDTIQGATDKARQFIDHRGVFDDLRDLAEKRFMAFANCPDWCQNTRHEEGIEFDSILHTRRVAGSDSLYVTLCAEQSIAEGEDHAMGKPWLNVQGIFREQVTTPQQAAELARILTLATSELEAAQSAWRKG
jgi:hypothetical protein